MSKLFLLCGLPGSGKSTWAKQHTGECEYISRDEIRFSLLKDGEDYFSHENEVKKIFFSNIYYNLSHNKDVIADATHLNYNSRKKVYNHTPKNTEIIVVYFNIPFELVLMRNNKRTGRAKVPEKVIRNMARTFEPPEWEEDRKVVLIAEVND